MDGKIHAEALNVALADNTAELGPEKGLFANMISTFMEKKEGSGPCPNAFRMLMPPTAIALSGITALGALAKAKVKHVSRREDANDPMGHRLQTPSPSLGL